MTYFSQDPHELYVSPRNTFNGNVTGNIDRGRSEILEFGSPRELDSLNSPSLTYTLVVQNYFHFFQIDVEFVLGSDDRVVAVNCYSPYFAVCTDNGYLELKKTPAYWALYPRLLIELG